jgi:hypothetical protein
MFATLLPLALVAPPSWFQLQGLIRKWRLHFRPDALRAEAQEGITITHMQFFLFRGCPNLSTASTWRWKKRWPQPLPPTVTRMRSSVMPVPISETAGYPSLPINLRLSTLALTGLRLSRREIDGP